MQQINLETVKASKAGDRKTLAILAYDNACADPASANWRGVADILRLAIPATKAKAAEIMADSRFAPWSEHEIPVFGHAKKFGKSPIIVVKFADGETVRAPAVSLPGKPVNIGRALRVAFAFYRGRIAGRCGAFSETAACVAVPDIVSVICETTAAEYDPADCSARTAELRGGLFDYFSALAAAWEGDCVGTADCPGIADYLRTEYLKASHALRYPVAPAEYSNADRAALRDWTLPRFPIMQAIISATGDEFITGERAERLAFAIMTFWPDLTETPLSGPDDAQPLSGPDMPAERKSFKVPARFLETVKIFSDGKHIGDLYPIADRAAPSCILRAA